MERKTEFVEDLLVFLKTLSSDEFNNFALRSATTKKELEFGVFFTNFFGTNANKDYTDRDPT